MAENAAVRLKPSRNAADMPTLKKECDNSDEEGQGMRNMAHLLKAQSRSQSVAPADNPLPSLANADESANESANEASFTRNYFVLQDALDEVEKDVPMTDASEPIAAAAAAVDGKEPPSMIPQSKKTTKTAATPRSRGGATARARGKSSGSASRGGANGRGGSRGGRGGSSNSRGGTRGLKKSTRGGKTGGNASKPTGKKSSIKKADRKSETACLDDNMEGEADQRDGDDEMTMEEGDYEGEGEEEEDEDDDEDNGPYCICRGPDDHRWMIQCDQCEDWFHGNCVNITKELGESIILSYICPNCAVPGRYVTRFRKLCSLSSCRWPARLYAEDNISAAAPDTASYFCSDSHRDQWWDVALASVTGLSSDTASGSYEGTASAAVPEDKMPINQLLPSQMIAILASSSDEGVGQMLLHGLTRDSNVDPDSLMTDEERDVTKKSATHRYHLAEQFAMCKKMLELLDMAKSRHHDAVKAGFVERDACGYDDRLQHVGVQPHFERFLASAEGTAIFRTGQLVAPQSFEKDNDIAESGDMDEGVGGVMEENNMHGSKDNVSGADGSNNNEIGGDNAEKAATAGMCRKRKCKPHLSWFPTLARDVRMQMQDLTRDATAQHDNETRIRLAAVQRAFVKKHTTSEVLHVDSSNHSLSSLTDGVGDDGENNGSRRLSGNSHDD